MTFKTLLLTGLLLPIGWYVQAQADIPIIGADKLMEALHEEAAGYIEQQLNAYEQEEEEAVDTTGWSEEADAWGNWFRTSEWEAEVTDRPEGRRIGCICMDGTPQDDRGRGACAGRGGVRFWLHQQGDTLYMDPTLKHKTHPDAFSQEEKETRFAAYNESGGGFKGQRQSVLGEFKEIIMVMMVCLTVAYVARLYFMHHPEAL